MKVLFILLTFLTTNLFAMVDINNANTSELLELNGIGKSKSQKIINYRQTHGCFKSADELARVDGVSKSIISSNSNILIIGPCSKAIKKDNFTPASLKEIFLNPVNIVFIVIILLLGIIDQVTKKDLKSQIVSIGVLGTFVGIFIGLQNFDPSDIINSVNDILVGLKTAFFTSIVGMSVATILSVYQILKGNSEK